MNIASAITKETVNVEDKVIPFPTDLAAYQSLHSRNAKLSPRYDKRFSEGVMILAMLIAFTFKAKQGKEQEFETLLSNPESGLAVAKAIGANRNTLFLGNGRMVRIFEFPEGVKPNMTLTELAQKDAKVKEFLRKLSAVIEDGFDVDSPQTMDEFNKRAFLKLAYDVRA